MSENTVLEVPPPAAPAHKDEYDGLWIANCHLDEDFSINETYETRQQAIDAYADEAGEPNGSSFQTGKLHHIREAPSCPYDASDFFEQAEERAHDEWWEGALEHLRDSFSADGLEDELDKKLTAVWDQFCEKHNLVLEGYRVSDVEHHIVGDDESDAELAARTVVARFEKHHADLVEAIAMADTTTASVVRTDIRMLKTQHPDHYQRAFQYSGKEAMHVEVEPQ